MVSADGNFRFTHEENQHAAQKLGWMYTNGVLYDLRQERIKTIDTLYELIEQQSHTDQVAAHFLTYLERERVVRRLLGEQFSYYDWYNRKHVSD